uniref:Putative heme-binding protein n=1 Tax=Cathaya argyrophylla TaxID=64686 RepID=E1CGR9_CATAR|nr:putative heme-binding protein [Cathaya argyrophylla]BAJ19628.1 putative heme-binding protein [Cathaya argyrophylla]
MGLIPHSKTRTFSRFRAELTSESGSLAIHELEVFQYKVSASLRYLAGLAVLPEGIPISFRKGLESWVTNWWNTSQSQKIFDYIHKEKALGRFDFYKKEELFLLERMVQNYLLTHSQDLCIKIQKETISLVKMYNEALVKMYNEALVKMYNEDCTHIISHLLKNLIGFAFVSAYIILGKNKLVIICFWIQEFFYSLNDIMKAFIILLATDIGFHSPHGWELMIDSISENYGFTRNARMISGLVSTFPVILDTILKYWIFRLLNRISPSLVLIYHLMNE